MIDEPLTAEDVAAAELPEPEDPADEPEQDAPLEPEPVDEPEGLAQDEDNLTEAVDEPGGKPPTLQPEPSSELDIEKASRKLFSEAERHARRVTEIMGDDAAELEPCPLCAPNIPGFRWPVTPDEGTQAELRRIIGLPAIENYQDSTFTRTCDDCGGLGQVLSGSKVTGKQVVRCQRCSGDGFVRLGGPAVVPAGETQNGAGEVVFTDDEEPLPKTDPWGRPEGDPQYGVLPGFERV